MDILERKKQLENEIHELIRAFKEDINVPCKISIDVDYTEINTHLEDVAISYFDTRIKVII